jgi:catalase
LVIDFVSRAELLARWSGAEDWRAFRLTPGMPLTSDERILALSNELLAAFDALFGQHPGFRPTHAKGVLLQGTFTPSPEAASLTRAQHVTRPSTPVLVRFSDTTGLPFIPDTDPNANPRGMAIRFQLAEHVHTDIVAHSRNGFPVRTGGEFIELLRAIGASMSAPSSPSPIEKFARDRPALRAFMQPQPVPSSFAREAYFGLNAMRFLNRERVARYGRYRLVPDAGLAPLSDADVAAKGPNFLFDEIAQRIAAGPVGFQVVVQVAGDRDVIDDVTAAWPESRPLVPLGKIALTSIAPDNAQQQKSIIFDPIPRLDGIEPSDDPLLELRAAVYLISGRRRRAAAESK